MGKDYLGANGRINGLGFRVKNKPANEFSKSLLTDIDELEEDQEYYFDSFGVRRKRKKQVTELSDISVEEVSYVDFPATKKRFMIVKNEEGDDLDMDEEKELKNWESVTDEEIGKIRETISILSSYDLNNELKNSLGVLVKFFGEKEVKKYDRKVEWATIQNQLFGYEESDLTFINDEEISKSNEDTKWPSLSGQFDRNKRVLERIWEERNVEARAV